MRKKKRPYSYQMGGFNLPPALMSLFSEGSPTFEQVMQLAPQLDAGTGTDVFSRAFAEDNPDLITGQTMFQGSMAQATQANPLLTQEQIEEEAKRKTFLGIGKKRVMRGLEQENAAKEVINRIQGLNNVMNTGQASAGAEKLFGILESWFGQQGGSPFTPRIGSGKVSWEEAMEITKEDDAFIKGLKDDSTGRATVIAVLRDMGFSPENVGHGVEGVNQNQVKPISTDEDMIRVYKEIQGLNMSPKKGADNRIDSGFLDYLAGHYKAFQLEQWGLDPRGLKKMGEGGKAVMGYSDNSPYKYLSEINIPGNNITMENTGTPLIGVPDVGDPRIMAPYSGTHNFPGATRVKEIPLGQMGGNLKGIKLVPSGTQDQVPVSYDVWKGNKFLGSYQSEGTGEFKFYRKDKGKSVLDNTFPLLVPDQDYPGDGLGVWSGDNKIGYFNPGKQGEYLYSPLRKYGGATEIPKIDEMKKGGRKKRRMVPYYQVGGDGQQAPGQMEVPPVGVQLEEGEVFSTDQLDIIDTNARKKHKDMEKDVISDVLRGTDYVFSADPSMTISRNKAEKVSFGLGPTHYKEGEIGDMPEEVTAAEIMPDDVDEMILSDYVKEIRSIYPMSDRTDVFSRKTNDANKSSRVPYLAASTLWNEEKRTKGEAPMTGFVSNFENRFENTYTSGAGVDMTENQHVAFGEIPSFETTPKSGTGVPSGQKGGKVAVPHGQLGLDVVGQIGNFVTDIYGIFNAAAQGRTARRALKADRPQIEQLAQSEGLHSDLSYGAQMAGLAGQDPTVNAPQYDPTQLNARPRNVSPALFQIASARAMAGNRPYLDALFENSGDFSTAANAYSQAQAPAFGMLADLGMREVETNLGLETQYRDRKQDFDDRQVLADTTAQNATRTNANQLTGAMGNTLGASIGSRGRIAANRINSLRQNSLQQAQSKIDANAAVTAAVQNAGAGAANLGYAIESSKPLSDQGVNNNITFRSDKLPPPPPGSYALPGQIPEGYALVFKNGKYEYIKLDV